MNELLAIPTGTLGHVYAIFMTSEELSHPPNPELPTNVTDDDAYLQLRIRRTHDIWHVIAGLPISVTGEAATNGLTTEQLRWPGSALLIAADLIHRVSAPDNESTASHDAVDLGVAVAHGLMLGATAPPLPAQRWEEGWDRSLQSWRDELGLCELISAGPFKPMAGEQPV